MSTSVETGNQLEEILHCAEGSQGSSARSALLTLAADRLLVLTRWMLRAYPDLRRWEETDDVFQEMMLRLYRSLSRVSPRSTREFYGLAAVHIRRALIDLARHHFGPHGNAVHHRSDPELIQRETMGCLGSTHEGEPQTLAEWTGFHEAVSQLPQQDREVFELIWYVGSTYGDAANLLGISRRTAIRRMNQARLRLEQFVVNS